LKVLNPVFPFFGLIEDRLFEMDGLGYLEKSLFFRPLFLGAFPVFSPPGINFLSKKIFTYEGLVLSKQNL
jgi:hypothetical protein